MFENYELYTKFAFQETQCLILNRLKVMKKMMMAFLVTLMSVAAVCAQTTATQQSKNQTCAAQKCEKVEKECKNAVEKCDKAIKKCDKAAQKCDKAKQKCDQAVQKCDKAKQKCDQVAQKCKQECQKK